MSALVPIPVLDGQLAIPTTVQIPARLDTAAHQLAAIDGLATATAWARAAIVAAFVDVSDSRAHIRSDMTSAVEFAALGFAGLQSQVTVRRYAQIWLARFPRPEPMAYVALPDEPFPVNPQVGANSGEYEFYTPPEYANAARRAMGGIDLDPASSATANRTIRATRYYTEDDDGLTQPWSGRVWLNPPFQGALIARFVDRLIAEYADGIVTQAVVLTNNGTETRWGQNLLRHAAAVCFPAGRINFHDSDGQPRVEAGALQGQIVTYLAEDSAPFAESFAHLGVIR